ncbi:MAG: L-2-hydroxyglutarate oxidase [Acidimicrobiia bacterium]
MSVDYDVCVIGGGIIGLATARALAMRFDGVAIAVVEKEPDVGEHQTGRNSGVLHSGLYYAPGSLKAGLCVAGRRAMLEYCEREGIPVESTGKLVVANGEREVAALEELHRRGSANGLRGLEWLDTSAMRSREPHVAGTRGLIVPETGVVDFSAVASSLAAGLRQDGHSLITGAPVDSVVSAPGRVAITTRRTRVTARIVVNCAGLHADVIARLAGVESPVRIVPFRGEYYSLTGGAEDLVGGLVYPVPNPRLPFLGVHFTRRHTGSVEVGPNAVLAAGREHYRGSRPHLRELWSTVTYPGFLRLARRHWRTGIAEVAGSSSRAVYARRARRLVPGVEARHLQRAGSGIRAQAVTRSGDLVDDFVIEATEQAVHVLNAPSPGATASLAIGDRIADIAGARLA